MIKSDVEHELKTSLDGFVENFAGDHDQDLDTYDPRWQERFASLSQLFKIHWALRAPREQPDSLVRRQHDGFEASFKTLAAFDAFMKGKAIEHDFTHGLLMPRARISLT